MHVPGEKGSSGYAKNKRRNVMIAVIGLIMFAVSSYLALSKKMHLMVPFVVVPVIVFVSRKETMQRERHI